MLVDDHAVVRAGLARVLLAGGWQEVGEAATGAEALVEVERRRWDLVVLDIQLGEEDGLELAGQLRSLFPRLPLMVLSMSGEPGLVRRALGVGVRAFVVKDAQPEEVVAATLAARFGSLHLDSRVAQAFLSGAESEDRRARILEAVRRGLSNQEIADQLNLSVSSVKSELRALFYAHGVKDRQGLARLLHLTL